MMNYTNNDGSVSVSIVRLDGVTLNGVQAYAVTTWQGFSRHDSYATEAEVAKIISELE